MKQIRLFAYAFYISCKHSSLRLLCLFCVLLLCGGLFTALFTAERTDEAVAQAKLRIAVVNLDSNLLTEKALRSVNETSTFSQAGELVLYPSREQVGDEPCVITIPDGFIESVMTGENLSPIVEYTASGAVESLWTRQLAMWGGRALSAAQRGVYAAIEAANETPNLSERARSLLIAGINLELMQAFIERGGMFHEEPVSVAGALPLPLYYMAAMLTVFFFAYGFLFYPSVEAMRRFSRMSGGNALPLFCGTAMHVLCFYFALTLGAFALLAQKISAAVLMNAAAFALLCTLYVMAICLAFPSRAACAAGGMLLTAGMSLCAGLLLPLAQMPKSFSELAPLLPVHHAFSLAQGALAGEMPTSQTFTQLLAMAVVLLLIASVAWRMRRTGGQKE